MLGGSEDAGAPENPSPPAETEPPAELEVPANPKPRKTLKKNGQAALQALPAPAMMPKSTSAISYDPNVEDAQDPRAFEKGTCLGKLPPANNGADMSPPRPASLLGLFSAAATGEVASKPDRKLAEHGSDASDLLPSPSTLRLQLQFMLKDAKVSWCSNDILLVRMGYPNLLATLRACSFDSYLRMLRPLMRLRRMGFV